MSSVTEILINQPPQTQSQSLIQADIIIDVSPYRVLPGAPIGGLHQADLPGLLSQSIKFID
jgi:hypothetical protein